MHPPAHHPDQPPSGPSRLRRLARGASALVVAGAVALGVGTVPSGAQDAGSDAVAAARTELDAARRERVAAESRLAGLQDRKAQLERELGRLGESDAALTTEIAEARRQVREYAVAAYIDGGQTEMVQASLRPDQAAALSWRTGLLSGQAGSASDAADRFDALRRANDPDRIAAAVELDRVATAESEAFSDVVQTSARESDAEATLAEAFGAVVRAQERASAQAEQRAREQQVARARAAQAAPAPKAATRAPSAAALARPQAPVVSSTAGTGDATPAELAMLARIRQCESRGNYSIVSSTGRYRGAYQFSVQTWQGMGGSGDPAAASPAEQDMRALMLLRKQGPRAWPNCAR